VPHALTQDQKKAKALICVDLLHEAQNDATFVNSIIAEDESWCFHYDPKPKRCLSFSEQNKWLFTFPRHFADHYVRSKETRLWQSPLDFNI
jgi:hypothetical protein